MQRSDVDRIAEVIAAHQPKRGVRDMRIHCICGWLADIERGRAGEQMPTHQSEQLIAAGWVSPADVARIKAEAARAGAHEALRDASKLLEDVSTTRRDRELTEGATVDDLREDRLIRLGIAQAAQLIHDRAAAVEGEETP